MRHTAVNGFYAVECLMELLVPGDGSEGGIGKLKFAASFRTKQENIEKH